MRRPVVFENRGEKIFGVLHYPPQAKALPTVLICHGFTGTKVESHRLFVKLAERLEEKGMVALRFDFRGSGDSEGDFCDMTLEGEIQDAKVALDFLQALPEVDPGRLAILGLSMGGAVSATVAGRDPRISACALWSAVADFSQTFFSEAAEDVLSQNKKTMEYGANVVSREFLLECKDAKPHLELAKRALPVLVIHGTKDETIPPRQAELYRDSAAAAGSPVEYHLIPGADHTYHNKKWENKVLDLSVSWLERQLGAL